MTNVMINDVHLGYRGGSGGFILLHLLLSSGTYYTGFENAMQFEQVVDLQWQVQEPSAWKSTEIWPHVWDTIHGDNFLPRIYFFCNPTVDAYFNQPQEYLVESYSKVKDPAWPEINGYQDYKALPFHIRNECEAQHGLAPLIMYYARAKKLVWVYTDIDSQNELSYFKQAYWYYQRPDLGKQIQYQSIMFNDLPVDPMAETFLHRCHVALRLQDVINRPEILVTNGLISSVNQKQLELIRRWISLHPPDLLDTIGIKHQNSK